MDNLKLQTDPHLKRLACQLYTQLPEDKREALQVLGFVRQILFCLGEEWETVTRSAPILPFSTDQTGQAGSLRVVPGGLSEFQDRANRE
jgi:hypothetical protein